MWAIDLLQLLYIHLGKMPLEPRNGFYLQWRQLARDQILPLVWIGFMIVKLFTSIRVAYIAPPFVPHSMVVLT